MKIRILLLLLLSIASVNSPAAPALTSSQKQKQVPDKVKATRNTEGVFVGFEVGDYMHAVIEKTGGQRESYFIRPGMEYFLALNKGRKVQITYQVVDSYIREAGGVQTIERISAIRAGSESYSAWWKSARRSMSVAQLEKKYGPLVQKATLTQ